MNFTARFIAMNFEDAIHYIIYQTEIKIGPTIFDDFTKKNCNEIVGMN